jgi:hypothetical protein
MKKVYRSFRANLPASTDTSAGLRHLLLAATLCLARVTAGAPGDVEHGATALLPRPASGPGVYLPALGPAPLRILSPRLPGRTALLPPLAMFDPPALPPPSPPAATSNLAAQALSPGPTAPAGFTGPNGPVFMASSAAPNTSVAPPAPGYPPAPPDPAGAFELDPSLGGAAPGPIVTPQMLVQFFKPVGSNCVSGAWSVPAFVPPNPPSPRPSTATYQTP